MKLLNRYLFQVVLVNVALVTIMLAGLQIFILFVNQLDDLGKGDFGITAALGYVLLQTPYQVYLFFPMASLLGCLSGLGILANNRELIVMRAAGMSIWQITKAVLVVASITILLVTILGETIVPRLATMANTKKLQALSGGEALRTAHGVWLRKGNDFILLGNIISKEQLENVFQFSFDNNHRLKTVRKIKSIDFERGVWTAKQVSETMLSPQKSTARMIEKMPWDVVVRPNILKISNQEPDEMSLQQLRQYIKAQKGSKQNMLAYRLAFWQRLIQPVTTLVMMLLAIPFIFGPLRSSTMGSKLLVGACVGFGFHIINRFFAPLTQVLQWPPEIMAIAPTMLFLCIAIYLMLRKVV